jgi:hypothetical protein
LLSHLLYLPWRRDVAISQVTVTGTFVDFSGQAMTGRIIFTPTPTAVNDAGADLVYMSRPVVVLLTTGGRLSVDLAATDDTDGNPVGFTYTVTEEFDNFAGGRTYPISLPAANSPVDLADISPESSASAGTVVWAGMPVGGTTGQFMVKTGVDNYDAGWSTMADQYLQGTGSPNGVVTAVVGSTYVDTAATGGIIRYTKFTGSGNTGWLADPIDSAVVHKAETETISGLKTFTNTATFTTSPIVNSASGNPYFVANASDTSAERLTGVQFQRRGSLRWVVAKNSTAESGSNAGSDIAVYRYDDAGSLLGSTLGIIRSTGETRIGETTAGTAHLRLDRSAGNVGIITGTGSPEGVVTAPVGSMYTDTAATNGAIRWIKATGVGNTGWRVEYGDTGWRNIVGSIYAGPSLAANFPTVNALYMRRVGMEVTFRFRGDATGGALVGLNAVAEMAVDLPVGWRSLEYASLGSGKAGQSATLVSTSTLNVLSLVSSEPPISPATTSAWKNTYFAIVADYITNDAWPTTLIGTAV